MVQHFKIRGKTLADEVYDGLRGWLVGGDLREGFLPSETELGKKFGVSRKTVRTALLRLGREGFVVARNGQGWQLCSPSGSGGGLGRLVLASRLTERLFRNFHSYFQEHARMLGFSTAVVNLLSEDLSDSVLAEEFADAVGVLYFAGDEVPVPILNYCRSRGIPLVCAGMHAEREFDTVSSDNVVMTERLAEAVSFSGYRQVLMINPAIAEYSFEIRGRVFSESAQAFGIRVDCVNTADLWLSHDDVDAIVEGIKGGAELVYCITEPIAKFLLPHLLSRGIRIPQDVSLVTLGDHLLWSSLLPYKLENVAFSTHPWGDIARLATERLRGRIAGDRAAPRLTLLTPDFHEVDSMPPIGTRSCSKETA